MNRLMVTTRRASDKLPPSKFSLKDEAEGDDGVDEEDFANEQEESSDDERAPVSKKTAAAAAKARTAQSTFRGNRGKLANLLIMPMDLIVEVCSQLRPLDILNLARSTKALRNLFMHKSSTPMWRAARSSIPGFPDCPLDLSEPEYARLMFERSCYACGKGNCHKISYVLRVRLCERCWKKSVVWGKELMKDNVDVNETLLSMLPYTNTYSRRYGKTQRLYYYRVAVDRLLHKYAQVLDDAGKTRDKALAERFVAERRALVPQIIVNAAVLDRWYNLDAAARGNEGRAAATERAADITERLVKLGWTEDELHPRRSGDMYSLLNQPRPLTERIWKQVLPKLEKIRTNERNMKLEEEERDRVDLRKREIQIAYVRLLDQQGSESKTFPTLSDIYTLPSIMKFIDDDETPITATTWEASLDTVMPEVHQMQQATRRSFVSLLSQGGVSNVPLGSSSSKDGVSASSGRELTKDGAETSTSGAHASQITDDENKLTTLYRAASYIGCKRCHGYFTYPSIIHHSCYRSWYYFGESKAEFVSRPDVVTTVTDILHSVGLPVDIPREMVENLTGFVCLCCRDSRHEVSHVWTGIVDHFVLERRSGTVRATNHGADGHDRDDPLVKISAERIEEARAQYDKLKMPA